VTGTSIRGRVLDDTSGKAVSGATVTAGGRSTQTKGDGTFGLATDPGTVSFSVSASNYFTGSFSAVVQPDQSTNVGDLRLTNMDSGPPPPPM
jgi:hypothetical protein